MDRSSRIPNETLRTNSIREKEQAEDWDSNPMTYEPRIFEPQQSVLASSPGEDRFGDFWQIATECLQRSSQVGQDYLNQSLTYASVVAGKDPEAGHEALERAWQWGLEVSSQLWEKLEPLIIDYMPEDRNPFWVCSVVLLVFFLALAGLRADVKQVGSYADVKQVGPLKNVDMPPISAPYVKLPDGRRVAYREQGVPQDLARHTILVVHGFPSSRFAGIPGIKDNLLEEFGVRLIAYDRPGFGQSDMHSQRNLRTSAQDMAHVADALGLGEKFWVVGYSTGGIHAWAAMKYIPQRLAGVALFAPGGNFYAPNMTKQENSKVWGALTLRRRLMYMIARWIPSLLPSLCQNTVIRKVDKLKSAFLVTLGTKDEALMEQEVFFEALTKDIRESVRQGNAATLAAELVIQVRPWGFHLSDLRMRKKLPYSGFFQRIKGFWTKEEEEWEGFSAPIHIWQGTEDKIVPPAINEFAIRMVPQATLHRMEGEGHFSYFCFCDRCHRKVFLTLFGDPDDVKFSVIAEDPLFIVQRE